MKKKFIDTTILVNPLRFTPVAESDTGITIQKHTGWNKWVDKPKTESIPIAPSQIELAMSLLGKKVKVFTKYIGPDTYAFIKIPVSI